MNEADFSEIARLSDKYNKDPKSRIFVQLADVYRKYNMVDEALDVLNKGLEFHPQYPVAYLILGKCHYDKRSYIQARDAFEKTITLDPQNVVALRMLAKTCEVLKDETGQINAYKSIVSIDPLDANAKDRLSMLEAIQRKEPLYTVAMAEEYETQNNLSEALKIYEHLLFTDPSDLILNQKVSELKKRISEEKRKQEEQGIEELQIEKVFKTDELPEEKAGQGAVPLQPSVESGEEPAAHIQNEIQSLEDFLVEELEQAAEKIAAQPAAEAGTPTDEKLVSEEEPCEKTKEEPEKATEDILPDIPTPVEPTELKAVLDERVEEPPVVEIPQPTEPVETTDTTEEPETPPSPGAEEIPDKDTGESLSIDIPQPTEPVTIAEPSPTEAAISPESIEAPDETEKPETPEQKEETVVPEAPAEVSAEPPAAESVETTAPEKAEPPQVEPVVTPSPEETEPPEAKTAEEKPEEPKKPKEEDFKSFQEWLSGLLK